MMRITNGIMMNNCLNNINKNKLQMDKIYTQIESQKLFQKPSEDPIAAIRSLRLRSTYTEIEQYLEKNVEDAEAWMKITEAAMESLKTTIGGEEQSDGIVSYLNQGISEYQTVSEREKILSTLKAFREAIYQVGNEDNAGRTIFTGYRTDTTLTFMEDISDRYKITENLTLESFRNIKKVVDTHAGTGNYAETDIVNEDLHAVMLGYDGLDATLSDGTAITLSSTTNTTLNGHAVTVRSLQANGNSVYTNIGDNDVVFIPETGELIFGDGIYNDIDKNDMFKGALVENYVAIDLYKKFKELYYYKFINYEIDFLIKIKGDVIPVEVKSSKRTTSRSLNAYKEKYNPLYCIRISEKNFGFENNIKSVPLYAVFCIEN